ncbi:transglycosylase SLT domain-containing protein [Sediminibacterium sp.]|uniref:lytic transglycosylase domain-containing protein n=1 Tax=Sediminibacterium sp. TaxID=1917865 RepID=UPI003F709A08
MKNCSYNPPIIKQTGLGFLNRALFLAAIFCLISIALSAQKDSTTDKFGFKSLFKNKFDASKPYAAQLNPRAVSFVQEYMRKHTKSLEKMKLWGKPYFDLYDGVLTQYGIPKEMKYLSVIESNLGAGVVSWAGAAGPWQIMDFEAKRFGLSVRNPDERMDYNKSTHVAAKIMRELFAQFNDWLLVVAGYNGGAGRVRQAIKKTGSRDFWQLQYHLPEETRNHVKKFIATHYVMEGGGGWTTMTAAETKYQKENTPQSGNTSLLSAEELANSTEILIAGRYQSLILANELSIDIQQFNRWNPGFEKTLASGKEYTMRLPNEKAALFQAKKQAILGASLRALLGSN